jgi:hypothetical protein
MILVRYRSRQPRNESTNFTQNPIYRDCTCKHGRVPAGCWGQVAEQVVQLLRSRRIIGYRGSSDHLLHSVPRITDDYCRFW